MLLENIKFGDRLEISMRQDTIGGKVYVSQVEDIIDANTMLINMPISYGRLVRLSQKEEYSFLFFTDKGMLRYNAAITDYVKIDGIHFMKVKLLSKGERSDRRQFFRFDCLLPIHLCKVDKDYFDKLDAVADYRFGDKKQEVEMSEGILKNISGGGMRFVSNIELIEGDHFKSVMALDYDLVVSLGKILTPVNHFPKSKYRYQYKSAFTSISQADQEKIIQYIFKEQRKAIRKTVYGTTNED